MKDLLEDEVDEKFYISDEKTKKFIKNLNTNDSDNVDMGSPKFIGNVNREILEQDMPEVYGTIVMLVLL